VPNRVLTRCSKKAPPFDHLVGAREHGWGQLEAERPRGLEVDDQLVLGRCRTGRSAGFSPLRMRVKSQRIFSTKLVCDALHSADPLIANIITCRFDNF
jgi:hypothetical protein